MPSSQSVNKNSTENEDLGAFSKELQNLKDTNMVKGDMWFLIDSHYYAKLTDYLKKHVDFPGPVDNSNLLQASSGFSTVRLKENLQDELDYILVPERAWNLIVEKFGVINEHTAIARKVIESGLYVKLARVEVYPLEIKTALYSDEENVVEIQLSRACTLQTYISEVRKVFKITSTQVRVYVKHSADSYELFSNEKWHEDLETIGFTSTQFCVIDVEESGAWHITKNDRSTGTSSASSSGSVIPLGDGSSRQLRSAGLMSSPYNRTYESSSSTTPSISSGLCGLTNLGNTCFMNSALQCMSNVKHLTDYFVKDDYKDEINDSNPLGMQGQIAQSYGELVKQMWTGRGTVCTPRNFKLTVGRFAPQFSGYQQQDSQELMAFLLDGLHEDLNRVTKKPYIEVKDYDGEPDEAVLKTLAMEAWDIYKKRNNSVIVELFHGLYKSTVICPECSKISVTFDPFCYLSLPLPGKKEKQIVVSFVPADSVKPVSKMKVTVAKNGTIKDLCEAVGRLVNVNSSDLVVCDIYNNYVYKAYKFSDPVFDINEKDTIYVYEIPERVNDDQVLVFCYTRTEKKYDRSSFAYIPLPVVLPSGQLGYQGLKTAIHGVLRRFVNFPPPDEIWWRTDNNSDSGVEENGDTSPQQVPEVGRWANNAAKEEQMDASESAAADDSAASESQGNFFNMNVVNSQGSTVLEEVVPNEPIRTAVGLDNIFYVTLDWNPLANKYLVPEKAPMNHESLTEHKPGKKNMQLDECLDLFTTTEKLGQDDLWYCPRCKKHQQATKKFDLWTLPHYLIIHLKRFSYTRWLRDKIEGLVEFPVTGLDLSRWVKGPQQESVMYDLVAVSNHYGGLGGGHYTAYGKNYISGKWYSFDDSHVSPLKEEDVVTKAAYVLVYCRRENTTVVDSNIEMEAVE